MDQFIENNPEEYIVSTGASLYRTVFSHANDNLPDIKQMLNKYIMGNCLRNACNLYIPTDLVNVILKFVDEIEIEPCQLHVSGDTKRTNFFLGSKIFYTSDLELISSDDNNQLNIDKQSVIIKV